jgi:hypothetical protein
MKEKSFITLTPGLQYHSIKIRSSDVKLAGRAVAAAAVAAALVAAPASAAATAAAAADGGYEGHEEPAFGCPGGLDNAGDGAGFEFRRVAGRHSVLRRRFPVALVRFAAATRTSRSGANVVKHFYSSQTL